MRDYNKIATNIGAEGFQRATGKPFGRAQGREIFPACVFALSATALF